MGQIVEKLDRQAISTQKKYVTVRSNDLNLSFNVTFTVHLIFSWANVEMK